MDRLALPLGTRLGAMEITRVHAIGGFGIVYQARDHALDRDVAIKEFLPTHLVCRGSGPRVVVRSATHARTFVLALEAFLNEAKLLARFAHPAMVKVYSSWKANGTAYMAMPYLRGPTLWDLRRSMSEPPTEAWLRSVLEPLLDALQLLHAQRIYHRDIAPDNVILSEPGGPVLLDFGAARHLIGDRTQLVTAVVKPHYTPVEQYAEARRLRQGPWTDVYALSALLAYLLDGRPPPPATARAIHDEMEALAERRIRGVSRGFLSAIDWGLAVRPEDRPQSVAAFRAALEGGALAARPTRRRTPASADWALPPSGRSQSTPAGPLPTSSAPTAPWPPHSRPRSTIAGSGLRAVAAGRPLRAAAGVLLALAVLWPFSAIVPTDRGATDRAPAPLAESANPPAALAANEFYDLGTPVVGDVATPPRASRAGDDGAVRVVQASLPAGASPTATDAAATDETPAAADLVAAALRPATGAVAPAVVRRPARAAASTAGPNELCADRNRFMRPFCVHRRCDESRFADRLECRQLRQAALAQRARAASPSMVLPRDPPVRGG